MGRKYRRDKNGKFAGGGGSSARRSGESRRAAHKRNAGKVRYTESDGVRKIKVTNAMHEKRIAGALYGAVGGSVVGPLGTIAGARLGYLAVAGRQRKGFTKVSPTTGRKKKVGNSTLRTQVNR